MSIAYTYQIITFILDSKASTAEQDVLADTSIQQAMSNSLGQDMPQQYAQYFNTTTAPKGNPLSAYMVQFIVTPAIAANIVAGIPALKSRMLALNNGITDVVTWGYTIQYN